MFRIFIYISLALISCGKDATKETGSQNFSEREYRQLNQTTNMEGFTPSASSSKIPREKIKAYVLKGVRGT